MPWRHRVDAVLQAWYPGQQFGAALAAVLFGDSDPGGPAAGHLPRRRPPGPGAPDAPGALSGRQRRPALRRGAARRLPLVRRGRPAAAVPVRLRDVVRVVPAARAARGRRPPRGRCLGAREEHEPARRVGGRAALRRLARCGPASRRSSSRATGRWRCEPGESRRVADPAAARRPRGLRRRLERAARALHRARRHLVARPPTAKGVLHRLRPSQAAACAIVPPSRGRSPTCPGGRPRRPSSMHRRASSRLQSLPWCSTALDSGVASVQTTGAF